MSPFSNAVGTYLVTLPAIKHFPKVLKKENTAALDVVLAELSRC